MKIGPDPLLGAGTFVLVTMTLTALWLISPSWFGVGIFLLIVGTITSIMVDLKSFQQIWMWLKI